MSAMSNYLEGALIDHLFRATAYSHSSPGSWYIALLTAAFAEAGAGGTEVSTSATGYAIVAVVRGTSTWTKTLSTNVYTVENTSTITFGTPSANWGSVTHTAIYDALTSGNLVLQAQLQFAKTINNADPAPTFNAGELKFTFD